MVTDPVVPVVNDSVVSVVNDSVVPVVIDSVVTVVSDSVVPVVSDCGVVSDSVVLYRIEVNYTEHNDSFYLFKYVGVGAVQKKVTEKQLSLL